MERFRIGFGFDSHRFDAARKQSKLQRALKMPVDESVYDLVRSELEAATGVAGVQ